MNCCVLEGGGAARACRGSTPVVSQYSFCIVTRRRPDCWVYRETGCDTASSSVAIRSSMRHDTAQEARDTAERAATLRGLVRDATSQLARVRSDTAGHRRYMVGEGATIRLSALHDTVKCARGLCAAWAMSGCTVHSTQF